MSIKAKLFANLIANADWVSTLAVTLVNKCNTWYMVAFELAVYSDRLRLNTCNSTQNHDSTVKNAERAFNFYSKVYVTRCIDKVDCVVFPLNLSCSRLDCDTSFTFQFHVVHYSTNTVFTTNFVNSMNFVTVEQNTFRSSSLS